MNIIINIYHLSKQTTSNQKQQQKLLIDILLF